ncbi:MAG: hypothetical protein AAFO99_12905 [Bacteroidota bacterium]
MRKFLMLLVACALVGIFGSHAQSSYQASLGLGIDFGDDVTFIGPSGKYFFTENHAGQADLGFEDGATLLTFLYSYHDEFAGAAGLRWYAGAGLSFLFVEDSDTFFALRPHVGLDYKINNVPLAFSFDWRPYFFLNSDVDDRFEAAGFLVGFRYAFE